SGAALTARLQDGYAYFAKNSSPLQNSGLSNVVRTAVASYSTESAHFALTTAGALFAWGSNAGGMLGIGSPWQPDEPEWPATQVHFPEKPGTGKPPTIVSISGRFGGGF